MNKQNEEYKKRIKEINNESVNNSLYNQYVLRGIL